MKVLNLYAGIGGNRKLWEGVEVTAVEMNPKIAAIYQDFFPNDKVIAGDAHKYLEKNFMNYDFIWTSPPCPTHSRIRKNTGVVRGQCDPIYPSMMLYEEILFLKHYFKGKYCVENVIPYYKPLIPAQELARHLFWTNFHISQREFSTQDISNIKKNDTLYGRNISAYDLPKDYNHVKVLRNMVNPELGLHILNESKRDIQPELFRQEIA